ncbi:hypothetical protein CTI12_AA436200 [Artemisia annua]|uniref:SWIM-type domain-containing protein n=1 Tax=Artemisia annua TaxID=35608 RepID=A0A2U1LZH0_ARTAN|nr:hypothetical protein CTI12_AA436200 [Artemisia annua]
MAKGEPKKKKSRKDIFTVYFRYDGIFVSNLLRYAQGEMKEVNDTNFDEMSYENLLQIVTRLVPHGFFKNVYYCKTGDKLSVGLKEIKSDQDIVDMLTVGYENGNMIDMYVEHLGYDLMELCEFEKNEEQNGNIIDSSDDNYSSDDCDSRIFWSNNGECRRPGINETPEVDPDDNHIDPVYKVKKGVVYPAFNPSIPWDKMEPMLGMRYESPHQLKMALANYGVAHGYQLWYMKNDWKYLLVYCGRNTGDKLSVGLKEIKSDQDIVDMLTVGYENGNMIDMYVEHLGYDLMELCEFEKNEEQNGNIIDSSDDNYSSDDCEEIDYVDFQTEGDDSVSIKNISTQDPFLNKLCSSRILWSDNGECRRPGINETPEVDPDDNHIDPVYKVKKGVVYPAFNPSIPWDKMEPMLGMRYESPHQLKMALANYGVAHGYQLWYMKNDWKYLFVYCGRNVAEGKCAGKKGNKNRVMSLKDRSKGKQGKKVVKKKNMIKKKVVTKSGEGSCASPKSTKKQIQKTKSVGCPFRLWASWMSEERSFQIKSLIPEHKCCRNYNLGSIVTYKWIGLHYFKEIIDDPFMPLRKMQEDIKRKYMIQHEGGLVEHYGKLYDYRQAILYSNPRSTCCPDVHESANGLFWKAASCTLPREFELIMHTIKLTDQKAYLHVNTDMEVRKSDDSFGVNLPNKVYSCRMWELSGVPCVHAVAAYLHVNTDMDVGVSYWYSQEAWFNAYQFSVQPVFGSNLWTRTKDVPPLPPLIRRMPGRPKKAIIKAPCESNATQVSRQGRVMTCTNCWQKGHNKTSCKEEPQPKPTVEKKQPSRKPKTKVGICASSRGGGSGGRGRGTGGRCGGEKDGLFK